jgi:superfamily II DNA or RNA helicase
MCQKNNSSIVKTYLGQKGYSIYKNQISVNEQHFIREQLTVAPYMPKSPVKQPSFPIFLESPQKFYIPRFFGIEHFGEPDEIRVSPGKDIDLKFAGELRINQIEIVDKYVQHVTQNDTSGGGGAGLIELNCGGGKTVLALNIISQLNKKTLIIVHKGFLLSQWIERIKQFLPNARIGQIQGQIIDIVDKDIVIGMLQSLSMKEYPQEIFDEFGLTIIDECHHISSEVFSRSLQKIVTKYALGLSATMQRKDGLTRVFKMFLGEIVYKGEREITENVLVKSIRYITSDDDFNEIEYDFRGNVKYSTMISKLCNYNRRSEFILQVLEKELKINNKQQIMILAHNKCLLIYLFKAIEHRNIATVGYYIGGMKDAALKASESKQIIIATYSMAAEALDIKTLTTLLMATPKTDITQSVGRILRVKHEQPLIIDIVDNHDVFRKQYAKRKTFYTQNKYKIIDTNNDLYLSDKGDESDKWTILYDPKSCVTRTTKTKTTKTKTITSKTTNRKKIASKNQNIDLDIDIDLNIDTEILSALKIECADIMRDLPTNKCLINI